MFVKINSVKEIQHGNKESCSRLVNYLTKEDPDKSDFFSHTEENISAEEVIQTIDSNKQALGKNDAKFFMLSINPTHRELEHLIGREISDGILTLHDQKLLQEKLSEYTKLCMNEYAANFGRDNIKDGNDLLYYAKIETYRIHKYNDQEVKEGLKKIGENKEGLNWHVHVVVSRKSKDGKTKLSPQAKSSGNEWSLNGNEVKRGFNHEKFKSNCIEKFVTKYNYKPLDKENYIVYLPDKNQLLERIKCKELKDILQNHSFTSTSHVTDLMKRQGFESKFIKGRYYFTKNSIHYSITNKELSVFKIDRHSNKTMNSIANRFNLYEYSKNPKSYSLDKLSVTVNSFTTKEDKEIKYYTIHDELTKSSVSVSSLKQYAFNNNISLINRTHLKYIELPELRKTLENPYVFNFTLLNEKMNKMGFSCYRSGDNVVVRSENYNFSIPEKQLNHFFTDNKNYIFKEKNSKSSKKTQLVRSSKTDVITGKLKGAVVNSLIKNNFMHERKFITNTRKTMDLISHPKSIKATLLCEIQNLIVPVKYL